MEEKRTLVICEARNESFWRSASARLSDILGRVDVASQEDMIRQDIDPAYGTVLLDVYDVDRLESLITQTHGKHPETRIIVSSVTPTWKMAHRVIDLGANCIIRKDSTVESLL